MKVALVHDNLVEFGGAERVLMILLELFPDADVYTAYADDTLIRTHFPHLKRDKVHTSFLQPFPVRHHTSLVQVIAPLVWGSFDLTDYDLVISQSMHIMSAFVHVSHGLHICVMESPPKNLIGTDPPVPLQRVIAYTRPIRAQFQHTLNGIAYILTNSKHSQKLLKDTLGVSSTVLYPPVQVPKKVPRKNKGEFFLCVSRIDPTKNLDLAVLAATKLHVPLKIVGVANTPPYERYLKKIAGPTVEFLGFRSDEQVARLYNQSIAFVFPSLLEDFGITPLEAMAHGVPVIAYHGGGAKETVVEGTTGTFFHTHSPESLMRSMGKIRRMRFSVPLLYRHALQFGVGRYKRDFMRYVNSAVHKTNNPISGKNG